MATYLSTQVKPATGQPIVLSPGMECETFKFALTANLGAGDTIVCAALPLNATVLDIYLVVQTAALDSGTSLTGAFGDTTTTTRYAAATSTFGRATTDIHINAINAFVNGSIPFTYTTATTTAPAGITYNPTSSVADFLVYTVNTAPQTAVSTGTLKGWVVYTLNKAS